MSYPAYIDNGGIAFGSGASVDVPYPATVSADDILIISVLDAAPDNFTTPAGWTLLATSSKHANLSCVWFAKRAAGTETGTETVTSDSSDGNGIYGIMSRFSGCCTSRLPIESIDFEGGDKWTTYTVPACTPSGTERLIIALPCVEVNNTIAPPTDWTEAFEAQSASGDGCTLGCEYIEPLDYTGIAEITGALGASSYRATAVMALVPDSTSNLISEATATIEVDTVAEIKATVKVGEATAEIEVTTDAEVIAKLAVLQANATIEVATGAEVLDPWLEEINCISEMQIEIKTISNMQ